MTEKEIKKAEQHTLIALVMTLFAIIIVSVICAGIGLAYNVSEIEKDLKQNEKSVLSTQTSNYYIHNFPEQAYNDTTHETIKCIQTTATAYCPCEKCCGKTDGITASGTVATAGRTIAVDPSVIPYGTEVVIDGHTYIAEDCGSAINGTNIDIFFNSHEEAEQFGKREVEILIKK